MTNSTKQTFSSAEGVRLRSGAIVEAGTGVAMQSPFARIARLGGTRRAFNK